MNRSILLSLTEDEASVALFALEHYADVDSAYEDTEEAGQKGEDTAREIIERLKKTAVTTWGWAFPKEN